MKVLIFGWEFLPHFSGGLGTACFGPTQALARNNTQILFVVRKADSSTMNDGVSIISARIALPGRRVSKEREEPSISEISKRKPGLLQSRWRPAEHAAWSSPGVTAVDDEIEVNTEAFV